MASQTKTKLPINIEITIDATIVLYINNIYIKLPINKVIVDR